MSNSETLSRPYAMALFEHSDGWSKDLKQMAMTVREPRVADLIDSPHISYQEKVNKFLSLFEGEVEKKAINLIRVLGESKRLSLIPSIAQQYEELMEKKENKRAVDLFSPFELTEDQIVKLTTVLKKQFGQNLTIEAKLDESLIGGFLAKSGDDVLDTSIKGKLDKLKNKII
jgi:F-type H+-transporting ATPase subunit delta